MEVMDTMRARHSVRQYKDEPIADNIRARLQQEVDILLPGNILNIVERTANV